jgi:hypothetical protein
MLPGISFSWVCSTPAHVTSICNALNDDIALCSQQLSTQHVLQHSVVRKFYRHGVCVVRGELLTSSESGSLNKDNVF